jgi:hypothetical protein
MEFWTEGLDGLIVSGEMDSIGEENDFQLANRVYPDTRAGEPQVAERFRGKPLARGRGLGRGIPP